MFVYIIKYRKKKPLVPVKRRAKMLLILVQREIHELCRTPPGKIVTLIICTNQSVTLAPHTIGVFLSVRELNTKYFCA